MLSVEAVIVVAGTVNAVLLVGGTAVILHPLKRIHDPRRIPLRARYRRGRHHIHPPWWTRVGAAFADCWRQAAATQALLRGVTL